MHRKLKVNFVQIFVILYTLILFILNFVRIFDNDFWSGEAYTIRLAQTDFWSMIDMTA